MDEIPRLNLNQFKALREKGKIKEIVLVCEGGKYKGIEIFIENSLYFAKVESEIEKEVDKFLREKRFKNLFEKLGIKKFKFDNIKISKIDTSPNIDKWEKTMREKDRKHQRIASGTMDGKSGYKKKRR